MIAALSSGADAYCVKGTNVDRLLAAIAAAALYLSPNTIKTHIRRIMHKLAVDDRVQAAVVALRTGLI